VLGIGARRGIFDASADRFVRFVEKPMSRPSLVRTVVLAFAASSSSVAIAAVQQYEVSIVPLQSSFVSSIGFDAPLAGTFKGNYDPVENPTGTLTRPGLFGGSGNNPIPYTAVLGGDGDVDTAPTGGFLLSLDLATNALSIAGLAIDLLGGDQGSILLSISINYSSFNTLNPTAIFPGGFTIPIPLGAGTIDAFSATQIGAAVGVVTPTGKTTASFAVAVPVELLFSANFNGVPIGGAPIPAILPLAGTIDFGGENVVLSLSVDQKLAFEQPLDPPAEFTDLPLALPTVLPPGGTANLLFSGAISSFGFDWNLALDLVADAAAILAQGDLNGDGAVDAADLAILLGAWGTSGPGDLDGDGVVDAADLAILLGAWG
jgi:hypothetical protein